MLADACGVPEQLWGGAEQMSMLWPIAQHKAAYLKIPPSLITLSLLHYCPCVC
jgi:hypothetical protein